MLGKQVINAAVSLQGVGWLTERAGGGASPSVCHTESAVPQPFSTDMSSSPSLALLYGAHFTLKCGKVKAAIAKILKTSLVCLL